MRFTCTRELKLETTDKDKTWTSFVPKSGQRDRAAMSGLVGEADRRHRQSGLVEAIQAGCSALTATTTKSESGVLRRDRPRGMAIGRQAYI